MSKVDEIKMNLESSRAFHEARRQADVDRAIEFIHSGDFTAAISLMVDASRHQEASRELLLQWGEL